MAELLFTLYLLSGIAKVFIKFFLGDGMAEFLQGPYVNIIGLAGLAAVVMPAIFVLGDNLVGISVCFGIGLFVLGISSLYILVKKLAMTFPWKSLLLCSVISAITFIITLFIDKFLTGVIDFNVYTEFIVLSTYRLFILLAIYFLFWKDTLWYRELKKRMNVPQKEIT